MMTLPPRLAPWAACPLLPTLAMPLCLADDENSALPAPSLTLHNTGSLLEGTDLKESQRRRICSCMSWPPEIKAGTECKALRTEDVTTRTKSNKFSRFLRKGQDHDFMLSFIPPFLFHYVSPLKGRGRQPFFHLL